MADVNILRKTSASSAVSNTDITSSNTRLNATDAHSTAGTTHPVKIPSAGTNYSYWGVTRLEVSANTANNTIDNMQMYYSGSFGTGVDMNAAAASAYTQAVGTEGETGSALTTANYSSITTGPSAISNYTSASTLALTASQTGTTGTGEIGDYVAQQVSVSANASVGATTNVTATYQYDVS